MDIDIQGVPTQRAEDGLALSSRNGYLTAQERQLAPTLYALMSELKTTLESGNKDFQVLSSRFVDRLNEAGFTPDYVEIRNATDLMMAQPQDSELVILMAAYLGKTRLIDNIRVSVA